MAQVPSADHRTNRLLAVLEPEDFAALKPHLEVVSLTRGQVLYDTSDTTSHDYFPQNAIVSLVNVMEDGGTVEGGVRTRGRPGPPECTRHPGGVRALYRADVLHRLAHRLRAPGRDEECLPETAAVDHAVRRGPARPHVPNRIL